MSLISRLAAFKSPHCCIHSLFSVTLFKRIPFSCRRLGRPAPTRCVRRDFLSDTKPESVSLLSPRCSQKQGGEPLNRKGAFTCGKTLTLLVVKNADDFLLFPARLHCTMKPALAIIFSHNKTPILCCRTKCLLLPVVLLLRCTLQASRDGGETWFATRGEFFIRSCFIEMESCKSVKTHRSGALWPQSQRRWAVACRHGYLSPELTHWRCVTV